MILNKIIRGEKKVSFVGDFLTTEVLTEHCDNQNRLSTEAIIKWSTKWSWKTAGYSVNFLIILFEVQAIFSVLQRRLPRQKY